ncbi:hypothetical protein C8F04DRAFT_1194633 [Mycena alexandri]|uniref:Uncharacterized protein n=1 Tax=Mycena alexandri TaxID=1745969 RepID=A0AAD6S742_9AGAR|nr:hypothetical protein C8F04DRAFT_1194633 [Mycena alexandri]
MAQARLERAVPAVLDCTLPSKLSAGMVPTTERFSVPARLERAVPAVLHCTLPSKLSAGMVPTTERFSVPARVERGVPAVLHCTLPAKLNAGLVPTTEPFSVLARVERGVPAVLDRTLPAKFNAGMVPTTEPFSASDCGRVYAHLFAIHKKKKMIAELYNAWLRLELNKRSLLYFTVGYKFIECRVGTHHRAVPGTNLWFNLCTTFC